MNLHNHTHILNLSEANLILAKIVCLLMAICASFWVPLALWHDEWILAVLCLIEVIGYIGIFIGLSSRFQEISKIALSLWFSLVIFIGAHMLPPSDGTLMLFAAALTYTVAMFNDTKSNTLLYIILSIISLLIITLFIFNFSLLPIPTANFGQAGLAVNFLTAMVIMSATLLINRTIIQRLQDNLFEAKLNADKANQAKSQFLSNISHEIRNPMQGIMGILESMLSANTLSTQSQYMANVALDMNKHLVLIVNDVLDYSKLEEQQFVLHPSAFSPIQLMFNCQQMFQAKLSESAVKLFLDTPRLPEHLLGDETRIMQIINNVVSNSIKFTDNGSIRISATYTAPNLQITVRDTGIGMSPTTLSQIFTRFSQGDESITKTYQGTGLGMAITQELTRLMEGKIDIQSTLDEGTETTITLPLPVTHMAKPLQRSLDDARERLNQTRILVVDDNDINLMIFASQLESAGVSVDTAISVPEAIDLLDNAYDLILTDICMPKLSGVDFINHINQQKIDCPVVAITGSISEQKMQEYDDVGFKDVLSKPIGNDQFLIRLAKVLS